MTTQDILVRFLRNLGSRKEVEQYLKLFAGAEAQRFALVKVGGGILARDMDGLASSLGFLKQVGLLPIVIHGAGPQLDDALAAAGIHTPKIDGLRCTPPEAMEVIRKVVLRENLRLVEALESVGAPARPVATGVFTADVLDAEKFGLVGFVREVNTEAIESSARAGHIPVVACLGETAGGQVLNINADVAARGLAHQLKPFKIIFLTESGGLLDEKGQLISAINLVEDYEQLMEQPWVHSGMRLKLQEIKLLLDGLPSSSSVSITAPDHLARELFTHKGCGTFVQQGESIRRFSNLDGVDLHRLSELIAISFQRPLVENYFDDREQFMDVYVSDGYRATAVLTADEDLPDIPYLDKFAVASREQGSGLGGSLWRRMAADHPRLYWRSRVDNPINNWYFEHATGSYKSGGWIVFWYGLTAFDDVKRCVERALRLPPTLQPASSSSRGAKSTDKSAEKSVEQSTSKTSKENG